MILLLHISFNHAASIKLKYYAVSYVWIEYYIISSLYRIKLDECRVILCFSSSAIDAILLSVHVIWMV